MKKPPEKEPQDAVESHRRREILRKAESAAENPAAVDDLAREGIFVGEPMTMTGPEFLAMLRESPDDGRPSVTVTCYIADTARTRVEVEDALCQLLEESGLGEWAGGGQGSLGDRAFFDATFVVNDLSIAVPAMVECLRRLAVGSSTTVVTSDGITHAL